MSSSPSLPDTFAPEPWQEPCRELLNLVEGLATEMAQRWRQGERPLAEEFFARKPELYHHTEAALELIAEELALRQEMGSGVDLVELRQRFPQWRREVSILGRCHHLLAAVRFPAVGEKLGSFHLQAELGCGAAGRVYLATQSSLGGRPVVLKLTPDRSCEHLSLARLQHTHIVPLFSVHTFPKNGLHGICLPYLGGRTLADLLAALQSRPPAQRTGRDLLVELQHEQAKTQPPIRIGGPGCRFLEQASYIQAVCWIGMCLAEALQYAHERDTLHLDIKASNILLAADGQPMLLDFHLARASLSAGASPPTTLGGTPGYMAPEHEAAIAAAREHRAIPQDVNGRADIYALGLVMVEALGGCVPAVPPRADALRAANPAVTTGLADLLAKCLAIEPSRRYGTAGDVAADLRRYLADLPLRGVSNRSPRERWRRWRRRRPYALPLLGLSATVVMGAALLFGHIHRQAERAEAAWQQGEQYLLAGRSAEALESFRRGEALIEDLPANGRVLDQLKHGVQQAERVQAAAELHQSCEQIRALYGVDLPSTQARAVENLCDRLWQHRDQIVQGLGQLPTTELQEQVRADLLDVAILWCDVHVRHSGTGSGRGVRDDALAMLAQAEVVFGPSCVLCAERRELLRGLEQTDQREEPLPAPRNAWEHYALGRLYLRSGERERAVAAIDRALALQPRALWANFYKGRGAFQAAAYEDAVVAFSVCVSLAPTTAWAVYHRGQAYLEQNRLDRAKNDFDTAMRLDPSLVAAVLGRGIVHYRQKHHAEALADLRHVLELEPTHELARKLLAQLKEQP